MKTDIFLKLDGIDGKSQDRQHPKAIQVIYWDWTVSQQSDMHTGSGGGTGKATFSDIEFKHEIDRASPNLFTISSFTVRRENIFQKPNSSCVKQAAHRSNTFAWS